MLIQLHIQYSTTCNDAYTVYSTKINKKQWIIVSAQLPFWKQGSELNFRMKGKMYNKDALEFQFHH